jgi:hypothetical protein
MQDMKHQPQRLRRIKKRRQKRRDPIPRNAREAQILEKVLAAVSLSRRENLPLRITAKIEGTRVSTIRRYAPSAIEKRKGEYRVKRFDLIPRILNAVDSKGMRPLVVRSSRSASKVARYMNAVRTLIHKGDASGLKVFKGKTVAGHKFITSTRKLKQLADAGLLELQRLYGHATRGR